MKRLLSLPGACLVALLLLPLLPGYKKKDQVKLVPVSGKVTTKEGQPLTAGHVTFWPTAGKEAKAENSTGEIQSNGTYTLTTGGREGAPDGKYKVTISPSMTTSSATAPPFNNKYTRQDTSDLTKDVPSASYDFVLDK